MAAFTTLVYLFVLCCFNLALSHNITHSSNIHPKIIWTSNGNTSAKGVYNSSDSLSQDLLPERKYFKEPLEFKNLTIIGSSKVPSFNKPEMYEGYGETWYVKGFVCKGIYSSYVVSNLLSLISKGTVLEKYTVDIRLFIDQPKLMASKSFSNFLPKYQVTSMPVLGQALHSLILKLLRVGDLHPNNIGMLEFGDFQLPVTIDIDRGQLFDTFQMNSSFCLNQDGIPLNETLQALKHLNSISWSSIQQTIRSSMADIKILCPQCHFKSSMSRIAEDNMKKFLDYLHFAYALMDTDMHECANIEIFIQSFNISDWSGMLLSCYNSLGLPGMSLLDVVYHTLAAKIIKESSKDPLAKPIRTIIGDCLRNEKDILGLGQVMMRMGDRDGMNDLVTYYDDRFFNISKTEAQDLFISAVLGNFTDISERLLSLGLVHEKTISKAVFQLLDFDGKLDIMSSLLPYISDFNVLLYNTETLLTKATGLGKIDYVAALIAAKVPLDCTNYRGWTPLFIATRYRLYDIAKLLMDAEADPMEGMSWHLAPLKVAAYFIDWKMIKLMLTSRSMLRRIFIFGFVVIILSMVILIFK